MALLAAPAAQATGETPATGGTPSVSATTTPGPEQPSTGGVAGNGKSPAEEPTGKVTASESAEPTASESTQPSDEPSPVYTRPTFCSGIPDEDRGKTGLRGLPSKIVAGSGWHEFTYRVVNVSKIKVMETDVSLSLGTADPKINDVSELSVTVEWYNSATGKWKPIEGEGAEVFDNNEFATVKSLKPGEYADAKMRIKIGEKAKSGSGYFFTIGHSFGEDGQCGFDEISQFDFTVLSAGSKPGKVEDAKGKPGKPGKPGRPGAPNKSSEPGKVGNKPAPHGGLDEIAVSGKLAATGSSSALPTVAAIGGVAVVTGAGAVFIVRRRKARSLA
ncbi:LAETG motif-containing sortase-dependent surface protein [Streptomyces sp. NPDC050636]|uniref:LAETG motif-containing sortase-dependent surface protein n=1 Tax=Streptomyces sp. NPDC050636 TaxID=3154510 RepID=UPI0034484ADB